LSDSKIVDDGLFATADIVTYRLQSAPIKTKLFPRTSTSSNVNLINVPIKN